MRPRDPPTHCADGVCRSRTRALALTIPSLVPAVFLSVAPAVLIWITLEKKNHSQNKPVSLSSVQPLLFSLCPSVRPSLRVSLSAGTPRMNGAWVGTPAEPAGRCALLCSRICSQGRRATQPHSGSLNAAQPCPAPPTCAAPRRGYASRLPACLSLTRARAEQRAGPVHSVLPTPSSAHKAPGHRMPAVVPAGPR